MIGANEVSHNVVPTGRHKGTPWTRVPVSYLLWMVNVRHTHGEKAREELERRGTIFPEIDISGHAINRASLCCKGVWQKNRKKGEGLHAWLVRASLEALKLPDQRDKKGRYVYLKTRFVIEFDGEWPVLITVIPSNKKEKKGGRDEDNRGVKGCS